MKIPVLPKKGLLLVFVAVVLAGMAEGQAEGHPKTAAKSAAASKSSLPKVSPAGRAALKKAAAVAAQAKGTKGEARRKALEKGAKAFEAVAVELAGEPAGLAAACYEAGELWRRMGELSRARPGYQKALELDPGRFAERAYLQLAHLERRQGKLAEAIEVYRKVAGLKPLSARAHAARLWIGRCHAKLGKPDLAVQAYETAVGAAGTVRQKIDACNRLALLLVQQGKLDRAGAEIQRAETAAEGELQAAGGKAGKEGKGGKKARSLKKALEKMSARKALQRARDKAGNAHKDAAALEKRR